MWEMMQNDAKEALYRKKQKTKADFFIIGVYKYLTKSD
jgi:hypothetical protein